MDLYIVLELDGIGYWQIVLFGDWWLPWLLFGALAAHLVIRWQVARNPKPHR